MSWLVEAQVLLGKVFRSDLMSWIFEFTYYTIPPNSSMLNFHMLLLYEREAFRNMASRNRGYDREKILAEWRGGSPCGSIPIVGLESCDRLGGGEASKKS